MSERRIPDPTLMARLQLSVKGVDWAASRVAPWQHASLDGEWSAHQHVFHLLANEHVFLGRIRRAIAEDVPTFERWDSPGHMAREYAREPDIETLAERFMAARSETYEFCKGLSAEQWARTFVWPDGRTHDLAWLAEKVLWHALDHFATLLDYHGDFEPLQGA
ncbi:MAG: DinB family protein [Dehalococcoidia bacterium]